MLFSTSFSPPTGPAVTSSVSSSPEDGSGEISIVPLLVRPTLILAIVPSPSIVSVPPESEKVIGTSTSSFSPWFCAETSTS